MKTGTKKTHLHLNLPAEAHQNLRVASVLQKTTITALITRFAMQLQIEKLLSEGASEKPNKRDFATS